MRFSMSRHKRLFFWTMGVLGALLALFLILILIAPMVIDLEAIRERVLVTVSQNIGGQVTAQRLDLTFFPRPGLVFERGSISLPGKAAGTFEAVGGYPKIVPLLRGNVRIAGLTITAPDVTIQLPERPKDRGNNQNVFSLDAVKENIAPVLSFMALKVPGLVIGVKRGQLNLSEKDAPVFWFRDIHGTIALPPAQLRVDIACASNLWEKLSLEGKLEPLSFKGKGDLEMARFQPQALINYLFPSAHRITDTSVDLNMSFKTQGLTTIRAEVEVSSPSLTWQGKDSDTTVRDLSLEGVFHADETKIKATLTEFRAVYPKLALSGKFLMDRASPLVGMQLKGKDVDIESTRNVVLGLAGTSPVAKEIFDILKGGMIPLITVNTQGPTLDALGKIENIVMKGNIREGKIFVPPAHLHVGDVQGEVVLAKAILKGTGLKACLGNSQARKGTVRLDLTDEQNPHLEVTFETFNLVLGEIYPLLLSFKQIAAALKDFTSMNGIIRLVDPHFAGPLFEPRNWRFSLTGEIENITVNSTLLPRPATATRGTFNASPEKLLLRDVQAGMADASLAISGNITPYRGGLQRADITLQGTIGAEAIEWMSNRVNISPELRLRSPLSVTQAHVVWNKDTPASFSGKLVVSGGPTVSFDVVRGSEQLAIKRLSIRNGESDASVTLKLKDKEFDLGFSGSLDKSAVDRLLVKNQLLTGWIKGDFSAHIVMDQAGGSTAGGKLQAKNLQYPWGLPVPVKIKEVYLEAADNTVKVESSRLKWGDTDMTLHGTVNLSESVPRVDMNIDADGLNWEDFRKLRGEPGEKKTADRSKDSRLPPLQGELRVSAGDLSWGALEWEPFRATVVLGREEVILKVTEGNLCGIATPALINIFPEPLRFHVTPTAKNQELDTTITCLWNRKGLINGTFDLEGNVAGEIVGGDPVKALKGDGELTARDGRIYRFGILAKIFAVLNVTEIFRGELPDLAKKGFGYKSIKATAHLHEGTIVLKQGIIDGTSMTIACQGDIDLIAKKLDLTVLVAPFKTIDRIIKYTPLIGEILGGNLISIPIKVTGNMADPTITPLAPSAVGSGLLNIMKRTLRLPVSIVQPLFPQKKDEQGDTEE